MGWLRYAWPAAVMVLGSGAAWVTTDWRWAGSGVVLAGALVLTHHGLAGTGLGRGRVVSRARRARQAVARTIQGTELSRREALEPLLAPIQALVEERVPTLARRAQRAEHHLRRYDAGALRDRQKRHQERAAQTDDADLRSIETRNAELLATHLQNLARIGTLMQQYDAQMEQVILALQGLNTRLTALDLADAEDLSAEIERLTQEVDLLEKEFAAVEVER